MNAIPDTTPLTAVLGAIATELHRSNTLYPSRFNSNHEAAAIIKEEFDEYWDEVKMCKGSKPNARSNAELTQLAAMCVKEILRFSDDNQEIQNPWSMDK